MTKRTAGIILLAAGGSTRFGSPKQIVSYKGTTLIRQAAETALATGFPLVVVLGASAEEAVCELGDLAVESVVNSGWRSGIGNSLKIGLQRITQAHPELDAVIIALCDQPMVTQQTFERLADEYEKTGKPIVASEYEGTKGVPALFANEMFGELLALGDDEGAKSVIERYEETLVASIDAPEAAFDIDTPADLSGKGN